MLRRASEGIGIVVRMGELGEMVRAVHGHVLRVHGRLLRMVLLVVREVGITTHAVLGIAAAKNTGG